MTMSCMKAMKTVSAKSETNLRIAEAICVDVVAANAYPDCGNPEAYRVRLASRDASAAQTMKLTGQKSCRDLGAYVRWACREGLSWEGAYGSYTQVLVPPQPRKWFEQACDQAAVLESKACAVATDK
jgi:hypothetical protein